MIIIIGVTVLALIAASIGLMILGGIKLYEIIKKHKAK